MASFHKVNTLSLDLGKKVHDWSADSFKLVLTNTQPLVTNAVLADITEISAANGYSAGGLAASLTSFTQTSGVAKLVLANSDTLTATGGSVGPFQWAVLYNDTSASKHLIGWYDYGSALTLAAGQQFQVQFDGTGGVITF